MVLADRVSVLHCVGYKVTPLIPRRPLPKVFLCGLSDMPLSAILHDFLELFWRTTKFFTTAGHAMFPLVPVHPPSSSLLLFPHSFFASW